MTDVADETTARVGVTASPATSSPQALVAGRASARPAAPAPGGRRGTGSALRKRLEIAFFVAPALLLFLFFVVVPIVRAVQLENSCMVHVVDETHKAEADGKVPEPEASAVVASATA